MAKGHLNNGRSSKPESYVKIPKWIIRSPAWRRLSTTDRVVWMEAVAIYNGTNNGFLALSSRVIADRIGVVSHQTVARSLTSLQMRGFLEITSRSSFSIKNRKASEYRLTHLACNKSHKPPSNLFEKLGKPHGNIAAGHGNTTARDSLMGDMDEAVIPFPKAA